MQKHLRLAHVLFTLASFAATGRAPVVARVEARDLPACESVCARKPDDAGA